MARLLLPVLFHVHCFTCFKLADKGPFGRIVHCALSNMFIVPLASGAHRHISLLCNIPSWMQLQPCPPSFSCEEAPHSLGFFQCLTYILQISEPTSHPDWIQVPWPPACNHHVNSVFFHIFWAKVKYNFVISKNNAKFPQI